MLIAALSPSFVTLLTIPFFPLAALSLIGSLIYVSFCRPFTRYHLGLVVGCATVLLAVGAIFAGFALGL